jgi:ATP-dependent helicase HrpA
VRAKVAGHEVAGYPALVDEGSTVGVRTFTTTAEQTNAMWLGTRRLLRLTIPPPARAVDRVLRSEAKLAMTAAPSGLHEDIITCALDALIERAAWTEADWLTLQADVKAKLPDTATDLASIVAKILIALQQVEVRLTQITAVAALHALEDIGGQLGGLVYPGFVSAAGALRLPDVHRYLRAILVRLDALPKNPVRDKDITARVQRLSSMTTDPAVRWMIEELRVSLFAQSIGTRGKVSEERILREIRERS